MKVSILSMLLIIAGASALPQQEIGTYDLLNQDISEVESKESIVVIVVIRRIINEISETIKNLGLDPLSIDSGDFTIYEVPFLVNVRASVQSLRFTGASNIAINRLDFNVLANRLSFDFSLPEISFAVGNAEVNANIFGQRYNGRLSGSLNIRQIRIAGQVTVRAGIISGVNIRSLNLDFTVGGITSDLSLDVLGVNYSNELNTLLNNRIPDFLTTYRNEINKMLEDYVWSIVEQ